MSSKRSIAVTRIKKMACRVCGVPMIVGINTVNPPRCSECGLADAIEAARQMHAKSGPYYDKWLESNGPKGRGAGRGTPIGERAHGEWIWLW